MEKNAEIVLEACVGSFTEAKKAEELGATRIELCENLKEGGTTPSYGTILLSKRLLKIPIACMIRPRGGNFLYSPEEIEIMKEDIEVCRKLEVESVVFGVLTAEGLIDKELLRVLVQLARPLKVVFHMAFDEVEDKEKALDLLIDCGVDRVLTKGCKSKAADGMETLKRLVWLSKGKIGIVAGGGVTKENFPGIQGFTGGTQFHGTKIVGPLN